MAKNLLGQLLSLTGLKSPDSNGYYDPSVYRIEPGTEKNSSGLSGVEKYLQKKNAGKEQSTTELTGVAKYLAKKYPEEQKPAEAEKAAVATELTGVAKYLAEKQQEEREKAEAEALANMTGVERYLIKLEASNKTAPKKKATGVDKYLAKQKEPTSVVKQTQVLEEAPKEAKPTPKAEEEKPVVEEKKESQTKQTTEKNKAPEPAATTEKASATKTTQKIINLADKATQCQAATLKGTQCRRNSSLETIEKTINGQMYKFLVCSQHNNNDFTPLSELLQND